MERYKKFDLIIIGAGPAGLFLAREILLKSPNKKIAIIDNGRSISKRKCPLIENGKCVQCKICEVVYGIGGAGMYSDGKLSLWPAGSGLKQILNDEHYVKELNRYVMDAFLESVTEEIHSTKADEAQQSSLIRNAEKSSLKIKCYDVLHLGTEGIQRYCQLLEEELIKRGVIFFTSTTCLDIEEFGIFFVVMLKNARGHNDKIYSDRVALATGKASGLAIRNILIKLGVTFAFRAIELGVRVETTQQSIAEISECHLDAKIKLALPNDTEVRSFCLCNGGYLVSCYYDSFLDGAERICTISGFSFQDKKSENSNFGLLVRKELPPPMDPIKIQLGIVQAINRASGTGATVVQRYGDFLAGIPTSQDKLDNNTVKSTLNPITPTDLRLLLPDYVIKSMEIYLKNLSELSPQIGMPDTLLHAPVWELCTDRVSVTTGMETNIPGFYVVGDASGWARGIIQAATTGVVAGRDILSKLT